jgi:D-glycero-alpha-D-manno-heptose-7-phosphate kinase|tara:strand:- start:2588 stop:3460 length:873 start_codon:yes stop_codon:yes gene_type:complete
MVGATESSAPVRVDLAGGWTDVGPYTNDFGGEVVNFAINLRVIARSASVPANRKADFEFPVPRGSGLGTSSAMNVALSALISPDQLENPEKLAEEAFVLESQGGNYCGRQDQWASAIGGFNHLLFIGDSVERMPFEPMKSSMNWLKKHLIISFSGKSRNSGEMQESVWSRYSNGDTEVISGLHRIRGAVRVMANGLQQDRRDMVVSSLREVCEGVDLIDKAIHDPFRDVVESLIGRGSAVAWKALGAGGGGCSAILCSPTGMEDVTRTIENADWEIIEWDFEDQGVLLHG